MLGGSINTKIIEQQLGEVLRLAASIQQGTVTASLILRKLGSYPRQNSLALALREIERTLLGSRQKTDNKARWRFESYADPFIASLPSQNPSP